ncbi:MAG: DUF167 domain-containing protein [Candidatus Stahlbacteria bacterium]|nr:DUF167 domain-containing protein [Candidatus Stahlbacteria bacterium]
MSQIIQVKVIPNAKKNEVKEVQPHREGMELKVYVMAPPRNGKANKLLLEVLAKHFNVPKSRMSILRGEKARNKVLQIRGTTS